LLLSSDSFSVFFFLVLNYLRKCTFACSMQKHIRVYTCTYAYKESMHIRVYTYTLPGYKNGVGNCAELKRFLHIRVYTWTYAYSRSRTRIHVHIRVCARTRIMSPDLWGRWEVRRTREASRPSAFCLYSIRLFYHVCVCMCVRL
jgi:hypothetical protein